MVPLEMTLRIGPVFKISMDVRSDHGAVCGKSRYPSFRHLVKYHGSEYPDPDQRPFSPAESREASIDLEYDDGIGSPREGDSMLYIITVVSESIVHPDHGTCR